MRINEVDLLFESHEKTTKGFVQLILSQFKDTEHRMETTQKLIQNDMNWIKLILIASLFAIMASKFFHL